MISEKRPSIQICISGAFQSPLSLQDLATLYTIQSIAQISKQILAISENISRVLLPHGPRLLGGGERGHSGLLHALASAGKR